MRQHLLLLLPCLVLCASGPKAANKKDRTNTPTGETTPKANGRADTKTPGGHISVKWSADIFTRAMAITADGKLLATGMSDGTIVLWDVSTGKRDKTLEGHVKGVTAVAFSSNGKMLVSGGEDKTVRLWNPADGKERSTLKGHKGRIYSVAISADGKTVASSDNDLSIKIWDAEKKKEIGSHFGDGSALALSPDARYFVIGGATPTVREAKTGKLVKELTGHEGVADSIALSSDGKTIATKDISGDVLVWNVDTAKLISTLKGDSFGQRSITITGDGKKILVAANAVGPARLWDVATKTVIATGPEFGDGLAAISADGTRLVYSDVVALQFWTTEAFVEQGQKSR